MGGGGRGGLVEGARDLYRGVLDGPPGGVGGVGNGSRCGIGSPEGLFALFKASEADERGVVLAVLCVFLAWITGGVIWRRTCGERGCAGLNGG